MSITYKWESSLKKNEVIESIEYLTSRKTGLYNFRLKKYPFISRVEFELIQVCPFVLSRSAYYCDLKNLKGIIEDTETGCTVSAEPKNNINAIIRLIFSPIFILIFCALGIVALIEIKGGIYILIISFIVVVVNICIFIFTYKKYSKLKLHLHIMNTVTCTDYQII